MGDLSLLWTLLAVVLVVSLIPDVAYVIAKLLVEPAVMFFQRRALGIDKVTAGPETLIGALAVVTLAPGRQTEAGYAMRVLVQGEEWSAISRGPLAPGLTVRIVERTGLRLLVTRHDSIDLVLQSLLLAAVDAAAKRPTE